MSAAARILIVDDEEFVRESLAELLRAHGHEVATARNGNEAVQWLESHRCDVILSDLRMPRADGMSLLAQARRHDARIPIVLITGAGGEIGGAIARRKQQRVVHGKEGERSGKRRARCGSPPGRRLRAGRAARPRRGKLRANQGAQRGEPTRRARLGAPA